MFNNSQFDLEKWAAKAPTKAPTKASTKTPSQAPAKAENTDKPAHTTKQASNTTRPTTPDNTHLPSPTDLLSQVQSVADELIARSIDITADYPSWLHLGFALAHGLGEQGRPIFHQVSSLYHGYDATECDHKYDSCLKDLHGDITIATFFHMARQAGIDLSQHSSSHPSCDTHDNVPNDTLSPKNTISTPKSPSCTSVTDDTSPLLAQNHTPTFSDKIPRLNLPSFLYPILDNHSSIAYRDMMLLGTLNIISGTIPTSFYGIYDRKKIHPPLYNIVWGGYASGKGFLELCKLIVKPIRDTMRRQYDEQLLQFQEELASWENADKASRGPRPTEPPLLNPIISANSSASAFYRDLSANGGWGTLFETEADTLSIMLSKSEYGDYSDLLRKAFHHEALSMRRVSDNINIEIDHPRLSAFLSCTGSQLPVLLPASNVANGLASRFLFYQLPEGKASFRNVFEASDTPLDDIYLALGHNLMPLHNELLARLHNPIQFVLSDKQQQQFLLTFNDILKEQFAVLGEGIQGFIFRLGLASFRIAMVLSLLRRLSERDPSGPIFDPEERALICDQRDLDSALTIVNCLVSHTACVYSVLFHNDNDPFRKALKNPPKDLLKLFQALPSEGEFHTSQAVAIANNLGIQERSAKRYLSDMTSLYHVLEHPRQGLYSKVQPQNQQS